LVEDREALENTYFSPEPDLSFSCFFLFFIEVSPAAATGKEGLARVIKGPSVAAALASTAAAAA